MAPIPKKLCVVLHIVAICLLTLDMVPAACGSGQDVDLWAVVLSNSSSRGAAYSSWEFRGDFGMFDLYIVKKSGDTGIVVDTKTPPATSLFSVKANEAVWVAEIPKSVHDPESYIENVRKLVTSQKSVWVTAQVGSTLIIAGDLWKISPSLPKTLTTIAVSPSEVVRPDEGALKGLRNLSSFPKAGVSVPIIEECVREVSPTALMDVVTHLSTYHSRLSTSGGAVEAEAWITGEMIRYGYQVETFPFRDNFSSVVVATKTGSKYPDQLVIAGAHYDSRARSTTDPSQRAPGADDNGSGSSAMLEIARVLAENDVEFEYTHMLCFFSGEEQGLLGSRAYAKHLADQGADVVAMFNADMIGYKLPGTEVTLGMKDRYISDWLLAAANGYSLTYVPGVKVGSSSSCCSDHQSFTENGFPAIGFFENTGSASDYPHYHSETDLPQYIDKDNFVALTQAVLASVMSFAVPVTD
eukprot:m.1358259 g.1358259  ORF g.1358259 m.1358259 type:complete len:468 (+) comp24934_c1_seq31:54-1457(+)